MIFDNLQDAVLLIGVEADNNFRLLLCNEAFARDSGYSKESMGKLIKDIVKPSSYAALIERYQQALTSKKTVKYIDWFHVPLGKQAYEITLIPILNAVGESVQILAITRNVTELYLLREKVEKITDIITDAPKGK
jgi:PAS domain S-box-containing protein